MFVVKRPSRRETDTRDAANAAADRLALMYLDFLLSFFSADFLFISFFNLIGF